MEWIQALAPSSQNDKYLRIVAVAFLFIWNLLVATHLEYPYPASLVDAYAIPLTRMFLLGLVVLSAMWCPSVGIMAAMAYVCLGADVLFFAARK